MMDDNPLALGVGALLVALLAGFGIYRVTQRAKKNSGETSFLESRLQPDSFFGASGGQRIDTRDAAGNSSSMTYSLSQLDAIGDVDPVAEADVYLAYGRDLQAEEILKEAMRSSPSGWRSAPSCSRSMRSGAIRRASNCSRPSSMG
jgi:pilus assembly protein FimV